MKRLTLIIAAGLLSLGTGVASAQEDAASMAELLNLIEQGQARDSQEAVSAKRNSRNSVISSRTC